MRAAVDVDGSGVVDHLRVHDDRIAGLNDLIVAVIRVRKHRRTGRGEREALILKSHVLGALEIPLPLDPAALDLGRLWRERWNAAVRRIDDDRRAERSNRARSELAEERVVCAGAAALPR